ncbi:DUF2399 domain-containing protein [Paenibacillus psychroresistens]|uniref:DUF2399 domain-containing protein n=1 Tax=Paenibacillus psychroresistens TaxID=1778678 RepID=A0A6B8RDE1_9BACL|nr:Wadjet anti-phage system protein JetD domain-containing protein [Paenibacillus psychroresistens]QGQ94160.1 DUF2399 domain-containing protein [Paenibacillus psychroresistens]
MFTISQLLLQYIALIIKDKPQQRRKLDTHSAEIYIRSNYIEISYYQEAGGYISLHLAIQDLLQQGRLESITSAKSNGRQPELKSSYWIIPHRIESTWDTLQMLKMSDRLQLHKYRLQPNLQSAEEWQRIERVYQFLQERDKREWVTREERALELFQAEKWLSSELGLQFLRRLGLSLADLKAKVYGEPFVYWPRPGVPLSEAKQVLIVENLSMFHTCKRALEQGIDLLGLIPDAIIYGEGKKIEASLPFYQEIFNQSIIQLYYAGDIDPEGWSIYARLRAKFPEYPLQLAASIYGCMAELARIPFQFITGQQSNEIHFITILQEFELATNISEQALAIIKQCWTSQVRIPQEVITIETLQRVMGDS